MLWSIPYMIQTVHIEITNHSEGYWDNDNSCHLQDYLWLIDWFNRNHFDYRGLIEKSLALEFIISDVPSEGGTDRYCSDYSGPNDRGTWDKYEDCAIASIEYVLDNLI